MVEIPGQDGVMANGIAFASQPAAKPAVFGGKRADDISDISEALKMN